MYRTLLKDSSRIQWSLDLHGSQAPFSFWKTLNDRLEMEGGMAPSKVAEKGKQLKVCVTCDVRRVSSEKVEGWCPLAPI